MINDNPFFVLGLNEGATKDEVENAYKVLREKYRQERFETGQRGEDAAEKLQQLEIAYNDLIRRFSFQQNAGGDSDAFDHIKELIKAGNYDSAQDLLDDCSVRDAEWHYIQSTIFFQKSWYLEAKKQLEIAIQLEPSNSKYKDALDRLTKYLASNTISPDQLRTTTRPVEENANAYANNGTCTGSCCGDMCLANMCANCMCGGCH